ncbi:hypothetical protein IAU59_001874 [Kwoniella sp. CBS 9459]
MSSPHSSCHSTARPPHSPASHDDPYPSQSPIAITDHRHRSDTLQTTSSTGSSLPYPQTPQTPAITGVLHRHQSDAVGALSASPTESLNLGRRRKDSYGFGDGLRGAASPPLSPSHSYAWTRFEPVSPAVDAHTPSSPAGPSQIPTIRSPACVSLQQATDTSNGIGAPPTTVQPVTSQSSTSSGQRDGTSQGQNPANEGHPPANITIRSVTSSPVPSAYNDTDGSNPPSDRSRSTLKAAVRRKLERSKTSFRVLNRPAFPSSNDGDQYNDAQATSSRGTTLNDSTSSVRGKRSAKLRGLFAVSRNNSSTAIRRVANLNGDQSSASGGSYTTSAHAELAPPAVTLHGVSPTPNGLHDFHVSENMAGHSSQVPYHARHLSVDVHGSGGPSSLPTRPLRHPSLIGMTPIQAPSDRIEHGLPAAPQRIHRPRAMSMPLPNTHELDLLTMLQADGEEVQQTPEDLFDSMLPRELKLLILKTLLKTHEEERGNSRLCGEIDGRKELIRLSRVSKNWQDLCFDGQLWPLIQLEPVSHLIHPNALERIITSALPCIRELHLRGMNTLLGNTLLTALSTQDGPSSKRWELASRSMWMPNLHSLDLRHCDSLTSTEISFIVSNAPGLRAINLKGVQAVTSEVIRSIAKSCRTLQSLDVSRCWDITLGDIITLIRAMDDHQAGALHTLHLAGIKSVGRYAGDFLPLVAERLIGLETLDLQGCTHIYSGDFQRHREVLDSLGRQSSITHLNLSGCAALKKDVFKHLAGRFSNLTKFELADLPYLFDGANDEDAGLIEFLRTTPKIQKLDLERTGQGGGVTDRVMNLLAYGRTTEGKRVGQELVELRISDAKDVTPEAMVRVLKWCSNLRVFEADNTLADQSVIHEVHARSALCCDVLTASLLDCPALTRRAHDLWPSRHVVRHGWTGWAAVPFEYDPSEVANTEVAKDIKARVNVLPNMLRKIPVIKTAWTWRHVMKTARDWRESRELVERKHNEAKKRLSAGSGNGGGDGLAEGAVEGAVGSGSGRRIRLGRRSGSAASGLGMGAYGNPNGSCAIM